jgi:hypothetical protein
MVQRNTVQLSPGCEMNGTKEIFGFRDTATAKAKLWTPNGDGLQFAGRFRVVARHRKTGRVMWIDDGANRIVNGGIDWILSNDLAAAALYIGLIEASPTIAATDTMGSKAWTEAAGYDEAVRQTWGQGAPASQVVTNASACVFTMDGTDASIGGAFIATSSTKDETASTLIAAKAFTGGNKPVADDYVLEVTYSITGSSAA